MAWMLIMTFLLVQFMVSLICPKSIALFQRAFCFVKHHILYPTILLSNEWNDLETLMIGDLKPHLLWTEMVASNQGLCKQLLGLTRIKTKTYDLAKSHVLLQSSICHHWRSLDKPSICDWYSEPKLAFMPMQLITTLLHSWEIITKKRGLSGSYPYESCPTWMYERFFKTTISKFKEIQNHKLIDHGPKHVSRP